MNINKAEPAEVYYKCPKCEYYFKPAPRCPECGQLVAPTEVLGMSLYDFVKTHNADYDTYDTVYDREVTVCSFDENEEEEGDYYDKFRIGIMRFVRVVKVASGCELVCNWAEMIKRNEEVFREYTNTCWAESYRNLDEDDFIYEWIDEINKYCAGYSSEQNYERLVKEYLPRLK